MSDWAWNFCWLARTLFFPSEVRAGVRAGWRSDWSEVGADRRTAEASMVGDKETC